MPLIFKNPKHILFVIGCVIFIFFINIKKILAIENSHYLIVLKSIFENFFSSCQNLDLAIE